MKDLICPFGQYAGLPVYREASDQPAAGWDWFHPDISYGSAIDDDWDDPDPGEHAAIRDLYEATFKTSPTDMLALFSINDRSNPGAQCKLNLYQYDVDSQGDSSLGLKIQHFVNGRPAGLADFAIFEGNGEKNLHLLWAGAESHGHGWGRMIIQRLTALARAENCHSLEFTASQAGGYSWARIGGKPLAFDWESTKSQIQERLDTSMETYEITPQDLETVHAALQSDDPASIWEISDLRSAHGDKTLGQHLLSDTEWYGEINPANAAQMARLVQGPSFVKDVEADNNTAPAHDSVRKSVPYVTQTQSVSV